MKTTIKPCIKHNNPAVLIEDWIRGDHILAEACGCWVDSSGFSDQAEMIAWWNERPYLEALEQRIKELEDERRETGEAGNQLQLFLDADL